MLKQIKHVFRTAFRGVGLDVRRVRRRNYVDTPPPIFDDPREALYHTAGGKQAAFHCPLQETVLLSGHSFGQDAWNPFGATLKEYGSGACRTYEGSVLEAYFDVWQPANALEVFRVLDDEPAVFSELPNYSYVLPWESCTIEERLEATAE